MNPPSPLQFSRRSDFGPIDEFGQKLRRAFVSHESPLDLTISNPTRAELNLPEVAFRFETRSLYEPDPRGLGRAREALAKSYRSRANISAEDLLLTASTSEAYSYVLHALCDPGDAILVPHPSYPLFDQLAQLADVRLVHYPIAYDGAFHVDLAQLPSREACADQHIKAIVAVSPNNPTGNSLSPEEFHRLAQLGVPLVIDEVFRPYASAENFDVLSVAQDSNLTILLDGLSKRMAAPGLKLAWMLAQGEQREDFLSRVEWIGDAFLSPGAPVLHALTEVLQREGATQQVVRERRSQSQALLERSGLAQSGVSVLNTGGGWTALLRLPAVQSEQSWWTQLSQSGLWLQPGALYGLQPEPTFALSLLTPPATLEAGLSRLCTLVESQIAQKQNAPD